jgi:hypothetical protein
VHLRGMDADSSRSKAVGCVEVIVAHAGSSSLAEAAAGLAAAGVPVFPCAAGAKRPATSVGFHAASNDSDLVAWWWRQWPNANIGMPTGGDRVDVVDVDVRPSGSGVAAVQQARQLELMGPPELTVATPSGGWHLYFPAVEDRPQRCWALPGTHVDFRGSGGYVLLPPSVVQTPTGWGRYVPVGDVSPARPVDGAALRRHLQPPAVPANPRLHRDAPAAAVDRLANWVASRPEGTRNSSLFWAACRTAEAGVEHALAEEVLGAAAATAGLGAAEIAATIRSAYRTAPPQPTRPTPPALGYGRTL